MAVTRLAFQLSNGDNYIDLSKALSLHHRTMVRQKQVFTVYGGMLVDDASSKNVVSTAPNVWYTRAAVNRAFRAWKKQRSLTLKNADGLKPAKYADFKIMLNSATSGNYRDPISVKSSGGSRVTLDDFEYVYSQLQSDDGVHAVVQLVGDHSFSGSPGRYSASKGWLQTRPRPKNDNPEYADLNSDGTADIESDFISNMFDEGGDDARENHLIEDGDNPIYQQDNMWADVDDAKNLQMQCMVYNSATNPTQMIPGFEALCGLIHVNIESGTSPILFLDVEGQGRGF